MITKYPWQWLCGKQSQKNKLSLGQKLEQRALQMITNKTQNGSFIYYQLPKLASSASLSYFTMIRNIIFFTCVDLLSGRFLGTLILLVSCF